MNHFKRRRGHLHAEDISLEELAKAYGTPLYFYSTATLTRHYRVLERALRGRRHLVCYAVKANSNLSVLSLLARLGAGFDIVSGGELYRVLKAGGQPGRVVFSGVGKRDDEIAFALDAGVKVIDVESAEELARVSIVAGRLRRRAPIALRVNPAVNPRTHPYIATGLRESKFGVAMEEALRLYTLAANDPALEVKGVAMHIGSQITEVRPFLDALARLLALVDDLARLGLHIEHLDLGGGLGIAYRDEDPPSPAEYGLALKKALRHFEGELIIEPGRVLVGNAGVLLTRVLYRKRNGRRAFVVVDAAMSDLIRPALYGAYHAIEAVGPPSRSTVVCDVVGPVCESADFLARARRLPEVKSGDLLCVRSAGAYGFAMASSYNSRPRPAEVLVEGTSALLARRRETLDDLVRGENPKPPRRRFGGRGELG
jgi:diaminopimelate decarboxylase